MNSYNKTYLEQIAREKGFVRDNLEKVMRLSEILRYFNTSQSLHDALVLKGGTAINLTVYGMLQAGLFEKEEERQLLRKI